MINLNINELEKQERLNRKGFIQCPDCFTYHRKSKFVKLIDGNIVCEKCLNNYDDTQILYWISDDTNKQ